MMILPSESRSPMIDSIDGEDCGGQDNVAENIDAKKKNESEAGST
jgi:hypothetical protein